jgi:PAS domain S-box-containing protein/putative nucleotidyltransferase with HDIG domain
MENESGRHEPLKSVSIFPEQSARILDNELNTAIAGAIADLQDLQPLFCRHIVGVCVHDAAGAITGCNRAASELLAMPEVALIGCAWSLPEWGIAGADGAPLTQRTDPVVQAVQSGKTVLATLRRKGRDSDSETLLDVEAFPRLRPDGSVDQVICSFTACIRPSDAPRIAVVGGVPSACAGDIPDYRAIADTVTDGVCLLEIMSDGDVRYVYVNASYLALTGFAEEQLLNRSPDEAFAALHAGWIRAKVMAAAASCNPLTFEERYDAPSGRVAVQTCLKPIVGPDGNCRHVLMTSHDCSGERRVEKSLKKANKRLANVLESIDEAFFSVDRAWRIGFLNPKAEKLVQQRRDEMIGRNVWEALPELTRTRIHDELVRSMTKQVIVDFEYEFADPECWVRVHSYPSQDGLSIYVQNITKRKRVEAEMHRTVQLLQSSLDGIVKAMALTIEIRDPYTAGHQRRVSVLAQAVAREMGMAEEQMEGIRIAALLHDIGKITVPTEILNKPTRLSSAEFSIIQTHPQIGYNILKGIDFSAPIALVAMQHHERMDGSGYPLGLVGTETIIEARIMAVADVVEAMASHRPYRPALGLERAMEEVLHFRGIKYDAACVDACLNVFTKNGFDVEHLMRMDEQSSDRI